jgi:K+-sensing histidine kinase KdpD
MRGESNQSGKMRDGQEAWSRTPCWRYSVAFASVGAAGVGRALLDPVLGPHIPFVTFYGAIALAIWFGGLGPGLSALILGLVTADFLFIEPRHTLFQDPSLANVFSNLSYCGVGLIICVAGTALHGSKSRAETSTESLREGEKWFADGENLFAEVPQLVTKTQLGDWKP